MLHAMGKIKQCPMPLHGYKWPKYKTKALRIFRVNPPLAVGAATSEEHFQFLQTPWNSYNTIQELHPCYSPKGNGGGSRCTNNLYEEACGSFIQL